MNDEIGSDETVSEAVDRAATRRRWVTLAELIAVSGVVIAGLGLYDNWSDRRETTAEKRQAEAGIAQSRARFDLRAQVSADGDRVVLSDPRHEIQEVGIAFPTTLRIPTEAPATPRIDREWFGAAILKATDGGADEREGRLPVLVTASYLDGEESRTGIAIVDVVWRTEGRVLSGRSFKIEAARLRERGGNQARIDALWARDGVRTAGAK